MTFREENTKESFQQWIDSHTAYEHDAAQYALLLGSSLEDKIIAGEQLSNIASSTIYSIGDVSSIFFGLAIYLLDKYWAYGPELKQWYLKAVA